MISIKREKVLEASFELFIEKGFHATSTKMILDASGVSNGALYHHFKTKEEILKTLYFDIKSDMSSIIAEKTKDTVHTREFFLIYWNASRQPVE